MKYQAVIFDLDGTLIDTLEDLKNSVNFALGKKGYPARTLDEIRNFVGNGVALLVRRALPAEADDGEFAETLAIFKEHYRAHSLDFTAPYPGIKEALAALSEAGVKTAVVTNKMEEAAKDIIENFFGGTIDVVIGQVDGLKQKPEPDGVFLAIEKLGADKSRCVYAGDSEVDCATARNAGLPVIGCTWGFRGRDLLEREKADYIIDSPAGIPGIVC